jgi:hypothetical protein
MSGHLRDLFRSPPGQIPFMCQLWPIAPHSPAAGADWCGHASRLVPAARGRFGGSTWHLTFVTSLLIV